MKLLIWNILHGGGNRLGRIVEEISAHDPDVVALTEFRSIPGQLLRAAFRECGWQYFETTAPPGSENGIAVFSQTPMLRTPSSALLPEHRIRWLDLQFPDYGFGLAVF